jgi:hypothetical protein
MTCILRIRYDLEGALLITVCVWLLLTETVLHLFLTLRLGLHRIE